MNGHWPTASIALMHSVAW